MFEKKFLNDEYMIETKYDNALRVINTILLWFVIIPIVAVRVAFIFGVPVTRVETVNVIASLLPLIIGLTIFRWIVWIMFGWEDGFR